jgi:hypothetical protein
MHSWTKWLGVEMARGLEVEKKIGKISEWWYHEHLCTYLRRSLAEGSLTEIQKLGTT